MWTRELDFVGEIADSLKVFFSSKGYSLRLKTELNVGSSTADIVILLSKKNLSPKIPQALSIEESVILASLRASGTTRIDLLEKRCGCQNKELRNGVLSRIIEWDLIEIGQGGQVALTKLWPNSFKIIALEAKLSRWRQAINQANKYQKYADQTFVVLPENPAQIALKNKEEFLKSGIGLLTVNSKGVKPMIKAYLNKTHDWRREFVYSRIII